MSSDPPLRLASVAGPLSPPTCTESPLGAVLSEKTVPNGLVIRKISVPLGVVGVIYEARPNVTVDVFALCFKAGNACVLKGGKEAQHSNAILENVIAEALSARILNGEWRLSLGLSHNYYEDVIVLPVPEATTFRVAIGGGW
jgi:glutamate-5-semialdehyde dehydrogenase